jgi:hypothetical protein
VVPYIVDTWDSSMYGKAADALSLSSANFMHLLYSNVTPTITNLNDD